MATKELYIDMPYTRNSQIWKHFDEPGSHCNESDSFSPKWKPRTMSLIYSNHAYLHPSDVMWLQIREPLSKFAPDCSKTDHYECNRRRLKKCLDSNPHFPANVKEKELLEHLKIYHPVDHEEVLKSVEYKMRKQANVGLYNVPSKYDLKLSYGIINQQTKVIIRLPLSRRNPMRCDEYHNSTSDTLKMTIKKEYQKNPVGAYAGNYERPIGSQVEDDDPAETFETFVDYKHTESCHIFDINKTKYETLDIKEKIESYIIKEDPKARTIVGPVTEIEKERVLYTCSRKQCIFPCLCHMCVQQTPECNVHKFKHPVLFEKENDHLLLRTSHNFNIKYFKGKYTPKHRYDKDIGHPYVGIKKPWRYSPPVEQVYLYAGIKKNCTTCTNDLYNHSAYHFVFHDKCKFCRYSSYKFEGITTREEYSEQIQERIDEEKRSCHICYTIQSSVKVKNNHIEFVHRSGGNFLCNECGKTYGSETGLLYHMQSQHEDEQQWMCKFCDKLFSLKHSLNVHVRNVHSLQTFECNHCSKIFQRVSHIIRHNKYIHGIYRNFFVLDDYPELHYYNCDYCSFQSRYQKNLRRHIAAIHIYASFLCSMCEFQSNRQDSLQRHVNTHHADAKYLCSECEYVTERKDNFLRHIDTVHGEAKYFCNYCDLVCNRKDVLNRHIDNVHNDDKTFMCEKCTFVCNRRDNLKTHIDSVHNDDKTFMCEKCTFVCNRRGNLKIHIDSVHNEDKTFMCENCTFVCNRKDVLKKHIDSVHNDDKTFMCEKCTFVCNRRDVLKRHIDSVHNDDKTFMCEKCNHTWKRKDELIRHIQKVHSKDV